jgi:hypothetical protein
LIRLKKQEKSIMDTINLITNLLFKITHIKLVLMGILVLEINITKLVIIHL